ncbi:MAG: B12-binding domain-containing radical SAM protein [Thermoplasmata archaeon]|nr:B12-binding domain-containing radical SAM protein [Thermoplasmata archaeon]
MNILFVYPSSPQSRSTIFNFAKIMKKVPFTFAQLIALTPNHHQIHIVDERYGDKIDFTKKYDLVAITSLTMHAPRAYQVADVFRKLGSSTVLGGYHPSAMPEEAKQHADAVVIGEAELTWPQLLKDFENGKLKPFYRQNRPVDSKLIPAPYRGKVQDYLPIQDVQATRGCPYRCEFCAIQNVEGHYYRKRPIEYVIEEIKSLKSKFFAFCDPSLTIDVEYTKSLFRQMKGLGKRFGCHGNINILHENEELIKLSKEAGCHVWYIGFESISQKSLDSVKKANKVKNYAETIKKIRKHGIMVKGLFMFGFDYDTLDSFRETFKAIKQWKLDIAYFSVLTPFPGTPLFKRLDEEGRIITKDWSQYTFNNVVFQPKNMSREELFNKTCEVAKAYYSFFNISQRIVDNEKLDFSRFKTKLWLNLIDRISIKDEFRF